MAIRYNLYGMVVSDNDRANRAGSTFSIRLMRRRIQNRTKKSALRLLLFCTNISLLFMGTFVFGWNPPHNNLSPKLISQSFHQLLLTGHPTVTRKKGYSIQNSVRLREHVQPRQFSSSLEGESTTSSDPPIVHELMQHMDLLTACLKRDDIPSQIIDILNEMMSLYTSWCFAERTSFQLRSKVSAQIDQAFRLVTNKAFSNPYQLNWVNTGIETMRLQLHSEHFNATNIERGSVRLMALQQPYNCVPKGTWLKALRALTSVDIMSPSSPTRSINDVSSSKYNCQSISPSDAAFRILQRLVNGRGIRTFRWTNRTLQQQSLDERDFNMVLYAYAAHSHSRCMHAAHRVIALQERTMHAPPLSPVAYSILIRAYGQMNDSINIEKSLLKAQKNGIVPDIVMVNTVLDAYVNCGLLEKAEGVFRSITSSGKKSTQGFWPFLRPNSKTYNILLKGMAAERDLHGAMQLSRLIQSAGLWDEITTNTLVKAAVAVNDFDSAEAILSNHTKSENSAKQWDHPNVEAYTELLDGYAKNGQLENALRILQLMQKRGVNPNVYTYTCIVGALARSHKIRPARKMINYAASSLRSGGGKRVELTPTYNAFISGLLTGAESTRQSSHAASIIEVLEVIQEMQSAKIHPNAVTLALVVDGLSRCNPPRCDEARELVLYLENNAKFRQGSVHAFQNITDISLSNKKIATAFIQAYGRANDVESAIQSFYRIQSADVVAFNALLDVCCRCNQVKLALDFLRKYASSQITDKRMFTENNAENNIISIVPDVVTYTTLISALLQLKTRAAVKHASSLYIEMKQESLISPDTFLIDTILAAMTSGGPIGYVEDDIKFTISVLKDGAGLEWEEGQYEKRKKAVRAILVGCSSEVWKNDEFAFGLVSDSSPDDPLFRKKGWNKIDSSFRLWGGISDDDEIQQKESKRDKFLASKGWNDIDSGFRLI